MLTMATKHDPRPFTTCRDALSVTALLLRATVGLIAVSLRRPFAPARMDRRTGRVTLP